MLKTRVRLGRSVTRSDQTHEFGVTLDGEIPYPPDDAEGVLEKVAELFHLADEALAREIERTNENGRECSTQPGSKGPSDPAAPSEGPRHADPPNTRPESATSKQVRYMLDLGKRKGLSHEARDAVITQVVGSPRPKMGDLTKREAGQIIDHLNQPEPEATA